MATRASGSRCVKLAILLGYFTLSILMPKAHREMKYYQHSNSRFGDSAFGFTATSGAFYGIYLKALGMVVSPGGGAFSGAPAVVNGFSFRWHSAFGGTRSDYAQNGVDAGGFSGVHARSALGGFDGRFSIEAEIIVAIPPALARDIVRQRGWLFPLPPVMLDKVKTKRQ